MRATRGGPFARTDENQSFARSSQFMRRAKEKERFENAGGSAEALARVAMQKAVDDRPEPAIFAKNRALINLPKVRKRPPVAPPAPFDGVGRWSCGGANPEVEAIHARLKEEKRKKKALKRARRAKDADVNDEEMAAFAKKTKTKKRDGEFLKPPELESSRKRKAKT